MKRTLHRDYSKKSASARGLPDVASGRNEDVSGEQEAVERNAREEKSAKKIRVTSAKADSGSRRSVLPTNTGTTTTASDKADAIGSPPQAEPKPCAQQRISQGPSSVSTWRLGMPGQRASQPEFDPPVSPPPVTSTQAHGCSSPRSSLRAPDQPGPPVSPREQAPAMSSSSQESGAGRRELWLANEKFSFVFDEITDTNVLALADVPAADEPDTRAIATESLARLTEKARRNGLTLIAQEIQRGIEGPLGLVMKGFMQASKSHEGEQSYQAARESFYELPRLLQAAKIAATNGEEAAMSSKLSEAEVRISSFVEQHFRHAAQVFNAEKSEKIAMKRGLADLAANCRAWKEKATIPAPGGQPAPSPDTRQRAQSSPVRPAVPWAGVETKPARQSSLRHSDATSPRSSFHRVRSVNGDGSPAGSLAASPPPSPTASPIKSPLTSPRGAGKSSRPASVIGIMPLSPGREPELLRTGGAASPQPAGGSSPDRQAPASPAKPRLASNPTVVPGKKQ